MIMTASLITAVNTAPDERTHKITLINVLSQTSFDHFHADAKKALLHCLDDHNIDLQKIMPAWLSLLQCDPVFSPLMALSRLYDYETFKKQAALHDLKSSLNDPYLLMGLQRFLIADLDFERLLKHLRHYMLDTAINKNSGQFLPFICALASQCFFNEYIYDVSNEEQDALTTLENGSWINHAVFACYKPLHNIPEATPPDVCQNLVTEQIDNLHIEQDIAKKMKTIGSIDNKTSQAVQTQYEENPYPRWKNLNVPVSSATDHSAGKSILVAGCGTGKEALSTALLYKQANITAIDLSRASLAYAARKAQEYGADNIDFFQADILALDQIETQFDFITSSGVLHHMDDLATGLQALAQTLKRGGLMRLALYSKIARRHVIENQQWVQDNNLPATPDGIRTFRNHVISFSHKDPFRDSIGFLDFFSLSKCRDMFFHVHEHNLTCLDLQNLIDDANLKLVSMAVAPEINKAYSARFPDDPNGANLLYWHEFEQDHPDSFRAMYQLWLAHKDDFQDGNYPGWITETV